MSRVLISTTIHSSVEGVVLESLERGGGHILHASWLRASAEGRQSSSGNFVVFDCWNMSTADCMHKAETYGKKHCS